VGGLCSTHTNILVEKCEGKRVFGRHRRRWECNIGKDLKETGWIGVDWMHLVQVRDKWWDLVKTVMNLRVPQKSGSFLTMRATIRFSKTTVSMEVVSY